MAVRFPYSVSAIRILFLRDDGGEERILLNETSHIEQKAHLASQNHDRSPAEWFHFGLPFVDFLEGTRYLLLASWCLSVDWAMAQCLVGTEEPVRTFSALKDWLMASKEVMPIESMIVSVRGHRVIPASDLASIYGVETRTLNQAVKRNQEKFPSDFMFQMTRNEAETLIRSRSQTVILKRGQNIKYLP